MMENQSLNQTK